MKPLLRIVQLTCFILVTLSLSRAAATWTTIDFPGALSTYPMGINNAGQIVGYYVNPDDINHGFIFEQGTYKTIDAPNAQHSYVFAINNTGQMLGSCACNGGTQGFVTNGQDFTFIAFSGSAVTWAYGINDLGQIVGSYEGTDGFRRAFTKNGQVFTTIVPPNSFNSSATGINNDGDIVGSYFVSGHTVRGFAYANGKLINVDFPGPDGAIVYSLNDRRQLVGNLGKSLRAFAYFQGKINTVVFPNAYYTSAYGINLNGDIVGSYGSSGGPGHGYLRSRGSD
jgi:probable HAF family extracellular repeat protein